MVVVSTEMTVVSADNTDNKNDPVACPYKRTLHLWKSTLTKRHAQINDLVNGLGRVASGLRQRSEACHQLSSTPLQAASNLKRKAIDDGVETPPMKKALFQLCVLNILPVELLCEIGSFIDTEELKTVMLVCKAFCNIYLPIYLSRYGSFLGRRSFWFHSDQDFNVFRSYHRLPNLPVRASLSAFFTEMHPDIQLESLAYALVHLPAETFTSISLYIPRYSRPGPQALSKLLTALRRTQCSELIISACLGNLNTSMAPIFTPSAFLLTELKLDGDLSTPFFQPLLLCTAPSIEALTLKSSNGNPNHIFPLEGWRALLGSGNKFPQLRQLTVSNDIPLSFLLEFLSHHTGILLLDIKADVEDSGLAHDTTQTFSIGSLSAICGSPQYILALLRRVSKPPSLSRLTLYASHLSNSSIILDTFKCLALCQKVDALGLSLSRSNCQDALHAVDRLPQLGNMILGIKKFRIMLLEFTHFSSDNTKAASNDDIVSAWREWHRYLHAVKHFELDEIFPTHDRTEVVRVLSNECPALAVSVRWGTHLMENQFAKDLGGFDFRGFDFREM